jgi:ankyrin repeat protein
LSGWLIAKADPNALTTFGNTPLNLAIANDNFDSARMLLAHGASVRLKLGRKWYLPPLYAAVDTELSWSSIRKWVTILLELGADPNAPGDLGPSPLLRATIGHETDDPGQATVIKALIHAGAEPNGANRDETTPLLSAVLYNNISAAELLLSAGADPLYRTSRGTIVDIAHENLSRAQADDSQPCERDDLRAIRRQKLQNAEAMMQLLRV